MFSKDKKLLKYYRCYIDRFVARVFLATTFIAGLALKIVPLTATAVETNVITGDPSSCTFSSIVTSEHATTIGLGESATDFGTTKITTVCENSIEHRVYAIGFTNNTEGNTDLINYNNNLTIPTGTTTGNISNWSMKISKDNSSYTPANLTIENSFDSNHVIPSSSTQVSSYDGPTDDTTGSSILATYSARASTTQPGGNYSGKVKFTLVATLTYSVTIQPTTGIEKITLNNVDCTDTAGCLVSHLVPGNSYTLTITPASGYTFLGWNSVTNGTVGDSTLASTTYTVGYDTDTITANVGPSIQNLSAANCTSTASVLYDERDKHTYTVQRLADGKCWMMENLDLGRTTLTTDLTSSNTNLATTITAATFNSWKKTAGTNTYDAGEFITVSGTDSVTGTAYGTLYNYYAASAGTITGSTNSSNAQYDICPAGWRLPTGGNSGEFQTLYSYYNSYALMRAPIANNGAAFTLAGYFDNSAPSGSGQGNYGFYYSSTRYDNGRMYRLRLDTSEGAGVYPANVSYRSGAVSIRCVLEESITISNLTYMQDFKNLPAKDLSSVLNSMEENTTYNLIDNRDNKSYAVAKMKDGNIWMAENLDLGRTTLSTDLTSSNTNLTATVAATTFNSWKKTTGTTTYSAGGFIPLTTSNTSNGLDTDPTSGTAYGTLYNYYAASAGTINEYNNNYNAMYDICPAGWKLPTGNSSGELQALYNQYNSNALLRTPIANGGAAFALAGFFTNNSPAEQGEWGGYWSSSRDDYADMYYLRLRTSDVSRVGLGRNYAISIRCLAKKPTHTLTVSYSTGVSSVTINNISITNNGTIDLEEGVTYTIEATLDQYYSFNSWSPTSGAIGSANAQSTTFIIGASDATITASATFVSPTISDLTYLQDFKNLTGDGITTVLNSMSYNTTYNLIDNRDNKTYKVARLRDGNIWMAENLDLGRTTLSTDLTSANTNLEATVSASTFNSWKKTSGSSSYTTGEFINVSGTDSTSGTSNATLYNYHAATAGTITGSNYSTPPIVNYDICPAGWRLPYGGNYGEYQALISNTYYDTATELRAPIANGGAAFSLSGEFSNSTPTNTNTYGYYWTSTVPDTGTYGAYRLSLGTNSVSTEWGHVRSGGISIRCIAKKPTRTITVSMDSGIMNVIVNGVTLSNGGTIQLEQNTTYTITITPNSGYELGSWSATSGTIGSTSAQKTTFTVGTSDATLTATSQPQRTYLQNLPSSSCTTTASIAYDNRDYQAYTIKRLADGNCWMTDNLALGAEQLTTNLTSENTNLIATVTASTFNSWLKTTSNSSYAVGEFLGTSGAGRGNLYNYYAASAGTIWGNSNSSNATYDICPAGWRLPTGGASGELTALYNYYNSYTLMTRSVNNGGAGFTLPGLFLASAAVVYYQGESGEYWTSTSGGGTYMYTLDLSTSQTVTASDLAARLQGCAIRCIMK